MSIGDAPDSLDDESPHRLPATAREGRGLAMQQLAPGREGRGGELGPAEVDADESHWRAKVRPAGP